MTDLADIVKPLVWSKRDEPNERSIAADCSWGRYKIVDRGEYGLGVYSPRSGPTMGYFENVREAKSAAQADYTRRVLAALDTDALLALIAEEKQKLVNVAVAEYSLHHPNEGPDERAGRGSAVRGMMVRLGVYDEFEQSLDRHHCPSPTATDDAAIAEAVTRVLGEGE